MKRQAPPPLRALARPPAPHVRAVLSAGLAPLQAKLSAGAGTVRPLAPHVQSAIAAVQAKLAAPVSPSRAVHRPLLPPARLPVVQKADESKTAVKMLVEEPAEPEHGKLVISVSHLKGAFIANFLTSLQAKVFTKDKEDGKWEPVGAYNEKSTKDKHAEENLLDKMTALAKTSKVGEYVLVTIVINNSPCGDDDKSDHNCIHKLEEFAEEYFETGRRWKWAVTAANHYKYKKNPKRYDKLHYTEVTCANFVDEDEAVDAIGADLAKQISAGKLTEDEAYQKLAAYQEKLWAKKGK